MVKSKHFSRNLVKVGVKYNKWLVIEDLGSGYWLCRCECGTEKSVDGYTLIKGKSRQCFSCGNKEKASKLRISGDHVAAMQAYGKSKSQARERQIYHNLTYEEFYTISKLNCYYCGSEPSGGYWENSSYKKDWHDSFISNGIDRFNNNIGYVISNCVPCCIRCNRAKNDMSIEEWKEKIILWYKCLHDGKLESKSND